MYKITQKSFLTVNETKEGNTMIKNNLRELERSDVMTGACYRKNVIPLEDGNILTVEFRGKEVTITLDFPRYNSKYNLKLTSNNGYLRINRTLPHKDKQDIIDYFVNAVLLLKEISIIDDIDLTQIFSKQKPV